MTCLGSTAWCRAQVLSPGRGQRRSRPKPGCRPGAGPPTARPVPLLGCAVRGINCGANNPPLLQATQRRRRAAPADGPAEWRGRTAPGRRRCRIRSARGPGSISAMAARAWPDRTRSSRGRRWKGPPASLFVDPTSPGSCSRASEVGLRLQFLGLLGVAGPLLMEQDLLVGRTSGCERLVPGFGAGDGVPRRWAFRPHAFLASAGAASGLLRRLARSSWSCCSPWRLSPPPSPPWQRPS